MMEYGQPRGASAATFRNIHPVEETSPPAARQDPARPEPPQRRRLMAGIPAGRILGIPVTLSVSLLVLAVVVAVLNGQLIQSQRLGLSALAAYGLGLAFVCGLIFSVLLHELGHAITARRFGVGVRGITLELIGGYTELEGESPRPRVEFTIAVVGPLISLVIGLIMIGFAALSPRGVWHALAVQLAIGNLIVAAYNALPGLPLDGGRAFAAVVWRLTGDRHRGIEAAGWAGRVVALITMVGGLLLYRNGYGRNGVGVVLALLVGMTIWSGASMAIQMGRVGRRIPSLRVDALTRPLYAVQTGVPLAEALRRAATEAAAGAVIGVRDGSGRVRAVVNSEQAEAVPEHRRPWVAVDSVARPVTGTLPLHLAGEGIIQAVQANPAEEYLVTSGDDVVGLLRTADLARLLDPRSRDTRGTNR